MIPKILIVDDARLTRLIIKNILIQAGFNIVGEAVNGREAIDMTRQLKPDVVTVDLTMPEMNGMESIQGILEAHAKARILIVTALGGQKLLQEDAKKAGALGMINKPFKPTELLGAIDSLMKYETPKPAESLIAPSSEIPSAFIKSQPIPLSEEQIENLMEVANIGSGNAASQISELIHERCLISLPQVAYSDFKTIEEIMNLNDSYVAALHIKIMEDIPADILVAIKRSYAHFIVKHLTKGSVDTSVSDLTFTAQFTLKQMGELMTRAFSKAINEFLLTDSTYKLPEIILDTWTTTTDFIYKKLTRPDELQMIVHCAFSNPEKNYDGKFVYILNQYAQKTILDRIELLLDR